MSKFLCFVFVLGISIPADCLGGHRASARFTVLNCLKEEILLVEESAESDCELEGFQHFEAKIVSPGNRVPFKIQFNNYQGVDTPEAAEVMLQIKVIVKNTKVGTIRLVREISPDPSCCLKNSDNSLGVKLSYILPSGSGGSGSATIGIMPKRDL